LITLIFLPPSPVRMTSNSVFSSAAGPAAAAGRGSGSDSRGGRDAPFVLERLGQLGGFENGQFGKLVDQLVDVSHLSTPVRGHGAPFARALM
jgi:uncharacterized membrane protein